MTAINEPNQGTAVEAERSIATAQVAPIPSTQLLSSAKTQDTYQRQTLEAERFYFYQYNDIQTRLATVEADIKNYKENITIKRISDIEKDISTINEKIAHFEEYITIHDIIKIKNAIDTICSDKCQFARTEQIKVVEQRQKSFEEYFKNNVHSCIDEYLNRKSEKRVSSKMYWMMIIGTLCGIISVINQWWPSIRSMIR